MKKAKHPRYDRLKKLADFLIKGKLGTDVFDFCDWFNKEEDVKNSFCKTSGCAIGQCPAVFPRHWEIRSNSVVLKRAHVGSDPIEMAERFFGIDDDEAEALFTPNSWLWIFGSKTARLSGKASPKQVGENILRFIALKKKEVNLVNQLRAKLGGGAEDFAEKLEYY